MKKIRCVFHTNFQIKFIQIHVFYVVYFYGNKEWYCKKHSNNILSNPLKCINPLEQRANTSISIYCHPLQNNRHTSPTLFPIQPYKFLSLWRQHHLLNSFPPHFSSYFSYYFQSYHLLFFLFSLLFFLCISLFFVPCTPIRGCTFNFL